MTMTLPMFSILIFNAGLFIGAILGWRVSASPRKKTRYFVDGELLRRWKFGHKQSNVISRDISVWMVSNITLSRMLTDCQEVDSLTAYRMFPNAFKKK